MVPCFALPHSLHPWLLGHASYSRLQRDQSEPTALGLGCWRNQAIALKTLNERNRDILPVTRLGIVASSANPLHIARAQF